jgi:cysteine desulfurase NifS/selenium donor protein
MSPVYLDYNATTPIDEEVAEYMMPFLKENFGNPSSNHHFGIQARLAINEARKKVAGLIGCSASEVIFTSGGTESNNLAIKGIAYALQKKGNHIISSEIEHPAVLEVCKDLEKEGFIISYLGVDSSGRVDPEKLKKHIRDNTILVSIMHANNETGIIQPVREISEITRERGIVFHSDAAQSIGKIRVKVDEIGVDLLSLAAHKFYGPKGIGALYIKQGINLEKLMHGANHERNLRPGTENILEIAGMGKAAEISSRDLSKNASNMASSRNVILQTLQDEIPQVKINGNTDFCLPNTLSIAFPGLDAATLTSEIPEIAVSTGAACHADNVELSHVLTAMGVPQEYALGTLRISTGKMTTLETAKAAAEHLAQKVRTLLKVPDAPSEKTHTEKVKLTRYTHGLGCACKISPAVLQEVLASMTLPVHPDILVGAETSDDAAVYRISDDTAIVQTVDFFTPVVDDPREFGAITAANALSDIYAMGGEPLFALNIVAFPPHRLPLEILKEILKGAAEVAEEADVKILGGHTIEDNEPKYGMVVTGSIHPDRILRNKGAKQGDAIILTKKLGTGILSTALKKGLCNESDQRTLYENMRQLNKTSSEVLGNFNISSCTDVTGFGLLGHLREICSASRIEAEIWDNKLPLLPGVEEFAADGIIPGGTENNYHYLKSNIKSDPKIPEYRIKIAADAQTSGGLLFTLPENEAEKIIRQLRSHAVVANQIGRIRSHSSDKVYYTTI